MSQNMNIKARRSFQGAEGMWRRGAIKTVAADRGRSLIAKGLGEETGEEPGSVQARETKPAPPVQGRPRHTPERAKPPRPTPAAVPPLEKKAERTEGTQTPADQAITIDGLTVRIAAHTFGAGETAFAVQAAELAVEAGKVYSVFAFRDGAVAPTAATGEEAVAALTNSPGAVLLDVVRIPEADAGNAGAPAGTGGGEPSSSSPPVPPHTTRAPSSGSRKPGKAPAKAKGAPKPRKAPASK